MADNSQNVKTSIHLTPNSSPDLSSTGDLGVDSADNRLKYNAGSGAENVVLQQDVDGPSFTDAANIDYDNTTSGLTATEVQAAIDEVEGRVDTAEGDIGTLINDVTNLQGDVSALQTGKQDADSDLTALAALSTTGLIARTGAGTAATRAITGTTNQVAVADGDGVSGNPTLSIASNPILPGTGSVTLPSGTTAERPGAPANAMLRYNSTTNRLEARINGAWVELVGEELANTFTQANTFDGKLLANATNVLGKQVYSSGFTYALANTKPLVEITATTAFIAGMSNREDGQTVVLLNNSGGDISIPHESSGATAANRFNLPGGNDITLKDGQAVMFTYSATTNRWHSVGGTGTSGGEDTDNLVLNPKAESNVQEWASYYWAQLVTFQDSGDTVTLTGHELQNGQQVSFLRVTTTTGITANTRYFVVNATTNTFQVATTSGGSPLTLTNNGTGALVRDRPSLGDGTLDPGADYAGLVTISRTTSSPAQGAGSFLITKDAANVMGAGVSTRLTLPNAYKARVLQVEFDYIVNSGTFAAGESSATGSLGDVTVWLVKEGGTPVPTQPTTFKLFSNSTGAYTRFVSNFQTDQDATTYMLCFHVTSPSTSAWELKIDNVSVKPSRYVYGTPITDWASFTPTITGLGTVTSVSFFSRRVGDSLEGMGTFTSGAVSGATVTVTLGYGGANGNVVADRSKCPFGPIGSMYAQRIAGVDYYYYSVLSPPSNENKVYFGLQSGSAGPLIATVGTQHTSGTSHGLFFSVPIVGWSSSVQTSDQADSRVVAARIRTTQTRTMNNTQPNIVYEIVDYDTHAAYNNSTGIYTVPVAGTYRISGYYRTSSVSATANAFFGLSFKRNGTAQQFFAGYRSAAAVTLNPESGGSTTFQFNAGDTISIGGFADVATTTFTDGNNYVTIERLSQASLMSATELVTAQAASSAGTTLSNGNTVVFGTENWDSHNTYDASTGIFTAPVSGTYEVGAHLLSTVFTPSASNQYGFGVAKNGTTETLRLGLITANAAVSQRISLNGSTQIKLNAGDTIRIVMVISAGTYTLESSAVLNYINIKRIGL